MNFIPPEAFLSFSRKQCLDALWRYADQADTLLTQNKEKPNDEKINQRLALLTSYLKTLCEHENQDVSQMARELSQLDLAVDEEREKLLMALERELKKDLREDQFLISTQDTGEPKQVAPGQEIHLVLDNLRSSFNVGSLFRTAEALGITHLHLCGYTSTPENSKTAKSALGADSWMKWSYWKSTLDCLTHLKEEGHKLYAFETAQGATPLEKVPLDFPCSLILGNERYGLGHPVLKRCHHIVQLNLHGRKNSLNVAVCGAIVMHHFRKLS